MDARLSLDAGPEGVAQARRFVSDSLRRWDGAHDHSTTVLLADELVTDAFLHARPPAVVTLSYEWPIVTVEVQDHGAGLPVVRKFDLTGEGGRGLQIVEREADHWGFHPVPRGGKVVWFSLSLDH